MAEYQDGWAMALIQRPLPVIQGLYTLHEQKYVDSMCYKVVEYLLTEDLSAFNTFVKNAKNIIPLWHKIEILPILNSGWNN
jgi:hypothetical protein